MFRKPIKRKWNSKVGRRMKSNKSWKSFSFSAAAVSQICCNDSPSYLLSISRSSLVGFQLCWFSPPRLRPIKTFINCDSLAPRGSRDFFLFDWKSWSLITNRLNFLLRLRFSRSRRHNALHNCHKFSGTKSLWNSIYFLWPDTKTLAGRWSCRKLFRRTSLTPASIWFIEMKFQTSVASRENRHWILKSHSDAFAAFMIEFVARCAYFGIHNSSLVPARISNSIGQAKNNIFPITPPIRQTTFYFDEISCKYLHTTRTVRTIGIHFSLCFCANSKLRNFTFRINFAVEATQTNHFGKLRRHKQNV